MNKSYLAAVLIVTCILGLGISARAQDADGVTVTVPFEFVAGSVTLPAGKYRVERVNPGTSRDLVIHSYDNGGTILLPIVFDGAPTDQPTLRFEHVAGRYLLRSVKTLDGVYTVPLPRAMVALAKQMKDQGTLSSSGTN